MRRSRLCVASFLLALASASCGGDDPLQPIPSGIEPTLSSIQENVFTPHCAVAGCHAAPAPQLGQDLSPGQAYASIVGVASAEQPERMRVQPGNAIDSYLFMKVTGDPRIFGERMPLGGSPLESDAVEAIRLWIENGAQDD